MASKLYKSSAFLIPSLGLFYTQRMRQAEAQQSSQTKNYFHSGVKQIPHPKKAYKGGEDAFVQSNELLAVADGVGGWNDVGVDPGIFARELCGNVWNEYKDMRSKTKSTFEVSLKQLLVNSVKKTKAKGSSTYVMALIDQDDEVIKTLNLGDSGLMIVRPKEKKDFDLIFRTKEQLYGFDFPYQCGTNCDLPYDADCFMHIVKHNDIVVLASDGIFDNLYDRDILDCLKSYVSDSNYDIVNPEDAAVCIAKTAETLANKVDYDSPFAQHAKEHKQVHIGGKVDDITVIVAQVKIPDIK